MTPEERQLLTDLAGKIAQTPPPPRDAEAEDFIRKNIGSRPDALYLMTQTVLIQNMAIQQAQQQIRELQQRAAQPGAYQSGYPGQAERQFFGSAAPAVSATTTVFGAATCLWSANARFGFRARISRARFSAWRGANGCRRGSGSVGVRRNSLTFLTSGFRHGQRFRHGTNGIYGWRWYAGGRNRGEQLL